MTWNEAFQRMQEGAHIKRSGWWYWCFQTFENGECRTFRIRNGIDERIDLLLSDEDLAADDWEAR